MMPTDWSVVDEDAPPSLDVDDLDSILLALDHFPTWFYGTAVKVQAMRHRHRADPLRPPDTDDEPWPAYPPTPARIPTAAIVVALLAGLIALVLGRVARRDR